MNEHTSPEVIEQDIEQTRAGISRTLDALQHRLSPDAWIANTLRSEQISHALKSAGASGAAFAGNLGRIAAEHPLPLVLTGVGLTWLAVSSSRPRRGNANGNGHESQRLPLHPQEFAADVAEASGMSDSERMEMSNTEIVNQAGDSGVFPISEESSGVEETSRGVEKIREAAIHGVERTKDGAAHGAEKVKSVVTDARERASEIGGRAAESAKKASHAISSKVERASEAVKHTGAAAYEHTKGAAQKVTHVVRETPARIGDAAHSVGGFVQENPILAGAIAAALGAGLALMIPSSRRESEILGEASDDVKTTVRDTLEEQVDRAKSVARTVAGAAADAARREVGGDRGDAAMADDAGEEEEAAGAEEADRLQPSRIRAVRNSPLATEPATADITAGR